MSYYYSIILGVMNRGREAMYYIYVCMYVIKDLIIFIVNQINQNPKHTDIKIQHWNTFFYSFFALISSSAAPSEDDPPHIVSKNIIESRSTGKTRTIIFGLR